MKLSFSALVSANIIKIDSLSSCALSPKETQISRGSIQFEQFSSRTDPVEMERGQATDCPGWMIFTRKLNRNFASRHQGNPLAFLRLEFQQWTVKRFCHGPVAVEIDGRREWVAQLAWRAYLRFEFDRSH